MEYNTLFIIYSAAVDYIYEHRLRIEVTTMSMSTGAEQ